MARRSNRPALYELTKKSAERSISSNVSGPDAVEPSTDSNNWLTPGVGIRVPGGFLLLGVIVLVLFVCLAWWLGYRQGVSQTEALMAASPAGQLVDPLLARPEANPPPLATQVVIEPSRSPLDRQKPWHFVLAETNKAGAERLAEFCRGQGLEVLVVPRHNTELARVIALPGMATSSRQAAEARAQDARIATLGRQWKRNGGRTDFSDRYVDRIVGVIE